MTLVLAGFMAVALVAITGVWALQLRTRNAGIVDAAWAYLIAIGGAGYVVTGNGAVAPRLVAGLLAAAWGIRLGTYLAARNHGGEERRYAELRARWGRAADRNMLLFFFLQAASAWVIALTFVPIATRTGSLAPGWLALGALVGVAGIAGESLADAQLRAFRREPRNRGRVCDGGLWRYSRHPNYFFESVHWLAYPCLAAGAPHAWLAWTGFALVTFLLLKVSGIPTVDGAASSRRMGQAEYERRTSAFIPLPPRERP